jgi:hypothetical protein
VQLIKTVDDRVLDNPPGGTEHVSSQGLFVLDNLLGINALGPEAIAGGGTTPFVFSDIPGDALFSNYVTVTRADGFEIYLMYRPAGADSIWVTLATGTWGWSGSARRDATFNWSLVSASTASSTSGSSNTLPRWFGCYQGPGCLRPSP